MNQSQEHSEEFRRALVDEALHRTPTGGYPALEKREGLVPGTLFDWVKEYGPPRSERPFEALHFWIGMTALPEDAFWRYFDHADGYWDLEVEDIEEAAEDVTGCGFCVDAGMKFLYDDDLMQIIWFAQPVSVRAIVDESTIATDQAAEIVVRACLERGMDKANAAFVYADPSFKVADPSKLFNGLPYIGKFRSRKGAA